VAAACLLDLHCLVHLQHSNHPTVSEC
jgi:hypothetical protein